MTAYNFFPRFADAIRSGSKRQTIRKAGKRKPPQPGQVLQLYTGLRTSSVCYLRDTVCVSAEQIQISTRTRSVGVLKGVIWDRLTAEEIEQLALEDGFASADEFFEFFADTHGKTLSGHLIKWEV